MRTVTVALFLLPLRCLCDNPEFQGYPLRRKTGQRNIGAAEQSKTFKANGHQWPQRERYRGWPPKADGIFSEQYSKSRDQIEAYIRKIPGSIHHRNDDWEELVQTTLLPRFTENGFKLVDAPQDVWEKLRTHYQKNKMTTAREQFAHNHLHKDPDHIPRKISGVEQDRLNYQATQAIQPILQEWAGVSLVPTSTYGVRVYGNGSTLFYHTDIPDTHVISAVFHIDHDLDEPWPLEIEDHEGRIHAVSPKPGQMVLYESAIQFHGRITPMRGRDYGSVYIHFKPVGWNWTKMDVVAAVPPDSQALSPNAVERMNIMDLGLPPIERYRHDYYASRGLPVLHFTGDDLLALPVQNAAMMTILPEKRSEL